MAQVGRGGPRRPCCLHERPPPCVSAPARDVVGDPAPALRENNDASPSGAAPRRPLSDNSSHEPGVSSDTRARPKAGLSLPTARVSPNRHREVSQQRSVAIPIAPASGIEAIFCASADCLEIRANDPSQGRSRGRGQPSRARPARAPAGARAATSRGRRRHGVRCLVLAALLRRARASGSSG